MNRQASRFSVVNFNVHLEFIWSSWLELQYFIVHNEMSTNWDIQFPETYLWIRILSEQKQPESSNNQVNVITKTSEFNIWLYSSTECNTYTMMLLIGMWISFTKNPMKPMMANPIAVAMAIFWNSETRKLTALEFSWYLHDIHKCKTVFQHDDLYHNKSYCAVFGFCKFVTCKNHTQHTVVYCSAVPPITSFHSLRAL